MERNSYAPQWILFAIVWLFVGAMEVQAQCASNTQTGTTCTRSSTYYGEVVPNAGCGVFTNVVNYSPGTHFRIPVLNGGCYTVSTCGASINTQVLAFQGNNTTGPFAYNDDNGPSCTGTAASINMVPNFTDYARVDIRQSSCLAGGTSSITVQVRQNNNLVITSSGAAMCAGTQRTLTATPAPVTVVAQPNSGSTGAFSGSGVSGNQFTAPLPSTSMQSYGISYTFGFCSTTQNIDVYRAPSQAIAGQDFNVCSATTTMNGNIPTYGTGTWSIISGPGTVATPTSYNATINGLVQGQTTTLVWTVSNGPCGFTKDTIQVFREFVPTTSVASPDQAICATSATVSGNTPSVGTGLWYLLSGSGNVTSPTNPNTGITAIGPGVNLFVWAITNGVCPSSNDTVVITRDLPPTPAFAGPDIQLCDSATTLNGNLPTVGNGAWSILSGGGTVSNPSNPTSPFVNVPVGTNTLAWTISNGACPDAIDTVVISRNNAPNMPNISGNLNVCEGSQTLLTASSGASIPNFTWYDAPTGGNILANTASFSTPPITGNVTYYVDVTDASTSCTSNRIPVTVTMVSNPSINLGADRDLCDNDTTCFTAPAGLSSYIWSNGATTASTCTANTGIFWLQVTDGNSCIGRDTVMINALVAPSVSLGADTGYCTGSSVTLGGFTGTNTYAWSTGATTASINVNSAGSYSVTCTASNGCSGADTVQVSQLPAVQAAFSIDTSFCPQIVFVDNSTGASNWAWDFGDGNTDISASPIHQYSNPGQYTVTLTATGLCGSDVATASLPISCIVGMELPASVNIQVYPNPSNGTFKVRFEGLETEAGISVWNLAGQKIYERNLEAQGNFEEQISLDRPAAGTYLLKIQLGDAAITKRIVVQ